MVSTSVKAIFVGQTDSVNNRARTNSVECSLSSWLFFTEKFSLEWQNKTDSCNLPVLGVIGIWKLSFVTKVSCPTTASLSCKPQSIIVLKPYNISAQVILQTFKRYVCNGSLLLFVYLVIGFNRAKILLATCCCYCRASVYSKELVHFTLQSNAASECAHCHFSRFNVN